MKLSYLPTGESHVWVYCLSNGEEVKTSLYPYRHHSMKAYGKMEVQLDSFLNSAQDENRSSASRPGHSTLEEKSRVPTEYAAAVTK
jgi:hypothetical protein